MSATPEQIADWLMIVAVGDAANEYTNRAEHMRAAAATLRAQAERVRVLEAKLEKIAGEAPTKEPPNYATVGPMQVSHEFCEYVAGMVEQAFHEGYTRALWEMGQIADAAALKGEA